MKKETVKKTKKKTKESKKLEDQLKGLVERDKLKDTDTEGYLSDEHKGNLKSIYSGSVKKIPIPANVHDPKYIEPRTAYIDPRAAEVKEKVKEQTLDEKIRDRKQLVVLGLVVFVFIILVLYAYASFK